METNFVPDYTARQVIKVGNYTVPSLGYIFTRVSGEINIVINGITYPIGGRNRNYESPESAIFPVKRQDSIVLVSAIAQTYYFIPCQIID